MMAQLFGFSDFNTSKNKEHAEDAEEATQKMSG